MRCGIDRVNCNKRRMMLDNIDSQIRLLRHGQPFKGFKGLNEISKIGPTELVCHKQNKTCPMCRYMSAVRNSSCWRCAASLDNDLKVISMSLYGSDKRYTVGAIRNAQLLPVVYPGWRLWIHCELPEFNTQPRYNRRLFTYILYDPPP